MAPPPAVSMPGSQSAPGDISNVDVINHVDEKNISPCESPTQRQKAGCWFKFRRSKILVILIVFIAMMLDLMLITSVEPILPPLVYSVMQPNATERFVANAFLFQRPEDENRVGMLATARQEKHVKKNHLFIGHHSHLPQLGNHSNDTAMAANFICGQFVSTLKHSNVTFLQVNTTTFYLNKTGIIVDCTNVSAYNDLILLNNAIYYDNDTVDYFNDPYLIYALEMSTLFSLKPAAEIFSNILSGLIVNRYGHRSPLVVGCLSTFIATLGFAFSPWYWMLAITRVVQAVGSSLSVVAGLALLSNVFTEDAERTRANSLAYDGLTVGLVLGMPFGSTLYNFSGRQTPFLILAFLVFVDLLLRCLYVDSPDKAPPPHANRSATECLRDTKSIYCSLLSNADVVVALCSALVINGALGALMATSPAFILDKYEAEQWEVGVILVCGAVAQLSSQTFSGFVLANLVRPWILSLSGFVLYGVALIAYTYMPSLWLVIIPECIGRIGLGFFTCIITPLLARIVDVCFQDPANYGAIFGLYVASYNLGLAFGPLISAILMDNWGATATYWVIGSFVIFAGLLNLRFRKPLVPKCQSPISKRIIDEERRALLSQSRERQKRNYTKSDEVAVRTGRSYSSRADSVASSVDSTFQPARSLV